MKSLFPAVFAALSTLTAPTEPLHEAGPIFKYDTPNHVHASSLVETPSGELIAVWYENGTDIDDPRYYYERRDKSSDVRLGGARKPAGAKAWSAPFVMADTFGVSDNNPTMVIDAQQRLWLIYPTLLGVPEWTWGSAVVRYNVANELGGEGAPSWTKSDLLIPHPTGLEEVIDATRLLWEAKFADSSEAAEKERVLGYIGALKEQLKNPLVPRLGWMPRAHPLILKNGTLLLPLSNENVNIAMMAMTKDGGASWTYSNPVPEAGLTQPTVVEFDDGQLSAFFRNGSPEKRIKRSDSSDGGVTWGPVSITDLVHPGAGIEALVLKNGHLLMIYNDVEDSPRDKLAVSISDDRGKTWKWTRHLEDLEGGRFDYPSIIQAQDGTLHATYSYNLETIKHVHFNEEWVQAGD
jgi:predicted neuraminidase